MTSIQPTGTQKQATEAASPSSTAPAVPTTKVSQRFGRKFEDLISLEFRRLHVEDHSQARGTENGRESPVISTPSPADEPWVVFTQHDHFGIALSGGGIRSATFNLGLLQGLDRNRVLDHVDYLSTVSGGGYVGGFWTAWKHTHRPQSAWDNGKPPKESFPRGESGSGSQTEKSGGQREADEIRHLREFSRFIMPRVGFTQAETWSGIVAILAGMVPSLTAAAALVTLAFYGWFAANFFLIKADLQSTLAAAALSMFTMLVFCEARWRKSG